ncbi:MAG: zinc ribbon domain-containing protein [Abditibacteriales bacterium]|nr:zinc ribbon domain-containing protein [Abditibacteriales bacterium]MDW8367034.1 zinc ribbon domain-containing protein [Abditibacteriales bacterium]
MRLSGWLCLMVWGWSLAMPVPAMSSAVEAGLSPEAEVTQGGRLCSKCQHENRPSARFCAQCGTKLQEGCLQCQGGVVPGDKFCTQCGADLTSGKPSGEPRPDDRPAPVQAGEIQPTFPTLKIGGFSDTVFAAARRGAPSGFNLGQLTLHANSALAPKVYFFSELTLTARGDAGTGSPPATGFNAEVERLIVRFDHSDQWKFSLGRYHTPINWWNNTFHHGLWLQTTIDRPQMTRFGGQFIPVHFIGALVEGSTPAQGLNLNYNLGVGNGRGAVVSRGGDAGDVNNNLAWLVNLFVKPDRPYGLQVGGSVYRDVITLASGREFREWIVAGHLVWLKETPEIIAEYAHVKHKEKGGVNASSHAYYLQVAYRLPWGEKRFKPYYRYERLRIPTGEPVFTATPDLRGSIIGVRYDVSDFTALKLEYRHLTRRGLLPLSGLFGQVSYAF